jgi:dipeptidyl aminopeptidase/acylaminoacyl peptidase
MKTRCCPLAFLALLVASPGRPETRLLTVDDFFSLREVGDPRIGPDGRVAYTVKTLDAKKDDADTDIYLVPLAGGERVRLTASPKSDSHPRWSPDGRFLAFLSDRAGEKKGKSEKQVWLLPARGGEAVKLTEHKGGVSDLAWSPDSTRLALVVADADPDEPEAEEGEDGGEAGAKKTPRPIVLRRLQFMRDEEGYLREARDHIHVLDVASKTSVQVTSGPFDDAEPAWSPDGRSIAFVSNRTLPDPDASQDTNVFVVEARVGRVPRAAATSPGEDHAPAYSPDGKTIVFVAGGDPKDMWYGASHVASVPAGGGAVRALTAGLDRNVWKPRFSPDGRSVLFLLEDGGSQHLARVPAEGGSIERLVAGRRHVSAFDVDPGGAIVVLESSPSRPFELSAAAGESLRRLTTENDAFLEGVRLGRVERFLAKSADGTPIDGFLTLPPDHQPGAKLPAVLRIHGGPAWLYYDEFRFDWQLLAARGYAVVASNPRGSTGYGTAFSRAIWADWGNKDFQDVMAAVDHVVGMGVADPDRLGVGGWSYGGMLTNYVVTKSDRFKAAVSGSSIANYLAGYGTDQYQYEYEVELGLPWKARDLWLRLSSPFFEIEKVVTPTLYLCGAADLNVPLLNSQQLYQALRRVGKADTELVVYPDQWHDIETPSYQKDRYERYLAWYDRYLQPRATGGREPEATSLLGAPLAAPEPAKDAAKTLAENLAAATAEFVKSPDSADAIVWLGRRTAYAGRFREAIEIYTRGIARHPNDARLYRHRGHRFVTVRKLDEAIADLTRASRLVGGKPDEAEPDSAGKPTGSLQFSIFYHLGLAHYLKGDFGAAERAYRQCLRLSKGSDDRLVAASDWLYTTLRRLGREDEAARVLEPIRPDLDVKEDHVYLNRLLMYKGQLSPEDLLRAGGSDVDRATYGYAVGNWHLLKGEKEKAKAAFERVLKGPAWPAFGFIAAEAERARRR